MLELSLATCPICHAPNSLSRETMERAGRPFTWYECQECGSVLLSIGDDQWAYQKVGREDKAYLLKQPMTLAELAELLPPVEEMPAGIERMEESPDTDHAVPSEAPVPQERRRARPSRLLLLGLAVTILGFVGAAIIMIIVLSPGDSTTPQQASEMNGTSIPVDTPTPVQLQVGTAGELESAIEDAPEGATIVLAPATFVLAEPLEIRKSLKLMGAGMDQTNIVCEAEGYVLLFDGSGGFGAEDITFRHQGKAEADVVVVEGGEVEFSRCRFTGAVSLDDEAKKAGLLLKGNTKGLIQDCVADENGTRGIRVQDQAQPTLDGNKCANNESIGISYRDSAGGTARENNCSANGNHGIQLIGQAQPTLEDNICSENGGIGITYFESSGGVARGNDCTRNFVGIGVRGEAQPILDGNSCTENEGGIAYIDHGGGTASENICSENEYGISVAGQAQPTLEENLCNDNKGTGITYDENGGGAARRNDCSRNEGGIMIVGQAQPRLEGNTCNDNEVAGITYEESGGGEARRNECSRNKVGIVVSEQAQPTLEANTCSANASAGITYMGESAGTASQNECSGSQFGITVGDQAQPVLEDSVCNDNELAGIVWEDDARGAARRNVCLRNGSGIYVGGRAQTTLEENTCNENLWSGISYGENGTGIALRNDCSRNTLGIEVGGEAQPTLEENVCNDNLVYGISYGENSGGVARRNELLRNSFGIYVGEQAQPTLEENICTADGPSDEKCLELDLDALIERNEARLEECLQSESGVRYVILGDEGIRVSLTLENDTGGTEQSDHYVPFCWTYDGFASGDFLYISAQIVEPTEGAGSITCRIYDGTAIIAEADATGFASIATCSGSVR